MDFVLTMSKPHTHSKSNDKCCQRAYNSSDSKQILIATFTECESKFMVEIKMYNEYTNTEQNRKVYFSQSYSNHLTFTYNQEIPACTFI